MIHSLAGALADGAVVQRRPYRDPHHSASVPALVGGGIRARPGEVSLAHLGVLFLDELPEFQRPALEALRQPLETGRTTIARANALGYATVHVNRPSRGGASGTTPPSDDRPDAIVADMAGVAHLLGVA